MALTLTKAIASQHLLKYTYQGSQGNFTANVTAAQMISDAAAGPLKDLLNRVNTGITSTTWGNLVSSKSLSLYVTQNGTSGSGSAPLPVVTLSAGTPNILNVLMNSSDGAINGTIELRYHPSQVR